MICSCYAAMRNNELLRIEVEEQQRKVEEVQEKLRKEGDVVSDEQSRVLV